VEPATLRPVPLRPLGPVDPAEAHTHVRWALPELGEDAARALALIEIAGRTRDTALEEMGVSAETLAGLLYKARKELRRSAFPLSASGWCERAERLLSDRIDGALLPPGPARLDVHLRNCERCVDHERRLSQAREKLVRDFVDAHPHVGDAGPAERPAGAAALRVVEPVIVEEPVYDWPSRTLIGFGGVAAEPGEDELPRASFAGPGGQSDIRVEPPVAHEHIPDPDELTEDPPLDDDIAPSEPADTTPSEHDAEDETPPVDDSEPAAEVVGLDDPDLVMAPALAAAINPVSVVWGSLTFTSFGLAVIALVLAVLALSVSL
jgi:Putative zinc-finger